MGLLNEMSMRVLPDEPMLVMLCAPLGRVAFQMLAILWIPEWKTTRFTLMSELPAPNQILQQSPQRPSWWVHRIVTALAAAPRADLMLLSSGSADNSSFRTRFQRTCRERKPRRELTSSF